MTLQVEIATEVTSELVEALADLLPQLNPDLAMPTTESLRAVLADPATSLLVARKDGRITGVAAVAVYTTPAWVKARIEDVVVDHASRREGVGQALVSECLNVARRRGARVVELQSARMRDVANRLYPRMGFELRESNVYRLALD